jgi:uncharacterized protein YqgC (DUF456 family)
VNSFALFLVGVAIFVGVVGIVVPVLPGALLSWAAILVWALEEQSSTGWIVLAVATVLIGASQVIKYVVPERRMRDAGIPQHSTLIGVLFAIAGFFLIPVVGMFVGFPLGVFISERFRLGANGPAWASTKHALKATGLSMLIELAGTLLAAGVWLAAVVWLV